MQACCPAAHAEQHACTLMTDTLLPVERKMVPHAWHAELRRLGV